MNKERLKRIISMAMNGTFKLMLIITFGIYVVYYLAIIVYDRLRKGKAVNNDDGEVEQVDISDFSADGEFAPQEVVSDNDDEYRYMPPQPEETDELQYDEPEPPVPDGADDEPPPADLSPDDFPIDVIEAEGGLDGQEEEPAEAGDDDTDSFGRVGASRKVVEGDSGLSAEEFVRSMNDSYDDIGHSIYQTLRNAVK